MATGAVLTVSVLTAGLGILGHLLVMSNRGTVGAEVWH